jgi:hypothetical protein
MAENDHYYMRQIPHELHLISISWKEQAWVVGTHSEPELLIFIRALNECMASPAACTRSTTRSTRTSAMAAFSNARRSRQEPNGSRDHEDDGGSKLMLSASSLFGYARSFMSSRSFPASASKSKISKTTSHSETTSHSDEAQHERSSVQGESIFSPTGERTSVKFFDDSDSASCNSRLVHLVHHPAFETTFAFLIIINSFTIAIEAQYQGVKLAHILRYPGSAEVSATWDAVKHVIDVLEFSFGVLFTLEVILKLTALRLAFFKSYWNLFDTLIVSGWILGEIARVSLVVNPMILRLCRLARIARLVRLLKSFQSCDSLHVLVNSIQASFQVLVWSTTLLAAMITLVGLITQHLSAPFLEDENTPMHQRHVVFEYYGSFTRSAVTFFEATLGNFGPIMRILSENIDEWWGLYFILYKCIGGFAIVSVITGVILHETFGVAQSDPDLMVVKERRQKRLQSNRMIRLFKAADTTGKGALNMHEFKTIVNDPFIQNWLDAMELHIDDAELLFKLIDDGDQMLTAEELLKGVSQLKGTARSMDLHAMMNDLQELKDQSDRIEKCLTSRHSHL